MAPRSVGGHGKLDTTSPPNEGGGPPGRYGCMVSAAGERAVQDLRDVRAGDAEIEQFTVIVGCQFARDLLALCVNSFRQWLRGDAVFGLFAFPSGERELGAT
jgi:hypothetical protein